jgi:hypothetical protein
VISREGAEEPEEPLAEGGRFHSWAISWKGRAAPRVDADEGVVDAEGRGRVGQLVGVLPVPGRHDLPCRVEEEGLPGVQDAADLVGAWCSDPDCDTYRETSGDAFGEDAREAGC